MKALDLYMKLPVAVQNLATTAYGMMLHHRRYGRYHRSYLGELLESQWLDAESLRRLQLERLRQMVDHAFETVPYYKEAYARAGYRKGDLTAIDQITQLPIVEKDDLREDPGRFISGSFRKSSLVTGNTSGTSGKPVRTFKSRESYQRNWAMQERIRRWHGVPPRSRRVSLGARHIMPLEQKSPPFWRHDRFTRNWLFSIYHMSPAHLPHYLAKMADIDPVEINGYPSGLSEVARAAVQAGETRIRPRVVISSAETLLDSQRELIETAFGCPVRDQYGSAENVVWVSQCEEATYHVHPEAGLLETVDGRTPVIDRPGQVVGTSFLNEAMPLIRYRLGDTLTLASSGACGCGRAFPVVTKIQGRTDDILITPDGRALGRLDPVFKGLDRVREGQILQDRRDHLEVLLVPDGDVTGNERTVLDRLTELFGPEMKIDFRHVDRVPRTASGKLLFQRSLLGPEDRS